MSRLGARRTEILMMVAEGNKDGEIATRLNVSHGMIKREMQWITAILDVPNRTAAAVKALQEGHLDLESLEVRHFWDKEGQ